MPPPFLPRLGKALLFFLAPVLLIVGGWHGIRYAKLHLALSRARREFTDVQFMRAEFWAGQALGVDPKNTAATRLMAEITEAQDKPAALGWRIRIARLEPGNTADILAWAKSALRFGQRDMALKALESLPADFKNSSADYHELMAGCALASHDAPLAEEHFAKAAELDPGNPLHRANLAAFRLNTSADAGTRAAAAKELEEALQDSRVNLFAARALLADAMRNHDRAKAGQLVEKLRSLPEHKFSDELCSLDIAPGGPDFQTALDAMEKRAEANAQWAAEMTAWLNSHGMAAEALRWSARLQEPVQSNTHVQMSVAESYMRVPDWKGLDAFLEKCDWGDGDFLKRAMLIRCKRELSQPWEKDWKQLAADAAAHPPDDLLLAQLVVGWNWRDEALALLWGATTDPASESQALQLLWDLYSQQNATRDLWRVARAQLDLNPTNPAARNNEAFLSLLLYGASERATRAAREVSTANPKEPEWAATYAYALHLAGKDAEAEKVMKNLPPETLARPGIALYYAIVLAANGDESGARESLGKLNPGGMLPEEQKLAADLGRQLGTGR